MRTKMKKKEAMLSDLRLENEKPAGNEESNMYRGVSPPPMNG